MLINFDPPWISNHMPNKSVAWNNLSIGVATVEIGESISYTTIEYRALNIFISLYYRGVITYPCSNHDAGLANSC